MSSYKNYNDLAGYRTRSNAGMGFFSVRNSPTSNSNLTGYRSTYSSGTPITRTSFAVNAKDRATITKGIHDHNDKLSYKYSGTSLEDARAKCPTSERTVFEKYAHTRGRMTPSSVVEKYSNRIYGRERSRPPETMVRSVVSTFPGSRLKVNYRGGEKEVQSGPTPVSYRPSRTSSTTTFRTYREQSPRVGGAKDHSPNRVNTRMPNYSQSTNSGDSVRHKTTIQPQKTGDIANMNNHHNCHNDEAAVATTANDGDETNAVAVGGDDDFHDCEHDDVDTDDDNDDDDDDDEDDEDNDDEVQSDGEGILAQEDCDQGSMHSRNTNAVTISLISRSTSPAPPVSSSLGNIKCAESIRYIQWEITRVNREIETKNVAIQCDWIGDTSRYSKYFSGARLSPWPSYLENVHSSNRTRNFGHLRHSESPTRPINPIGSSDSIIRQSANIRLKTSASANNIELHHSRDVVNDNTSLEETGKTLREAQNLLLHETTSFDRIQKGMQQIGVDPASSVTSSNSSQSLSSSSRRVSLSRSDGAVISSPDKSMSLNTSTKNSSNKRQLSRTDYLFDGPSVGLSTGKVKSASTTPSSSQSMRMRTPPSSLSSPSNSGKSYSNRSKASTISSISSYERNNVEECGKPPVPKTNNSNSSIRSVGSANRYVNKDFRKSALNMPDTEDQSSKFIYHRKRITSNSKSVPASPQNSTGSIKPSSKLNYGLRPRSNSEGKCQQALKNSERYEHGVHIPKCTLKSPSSLNHRSLCSTSSSSDASSDSSISESSEEPDINFHGCNEQKSENGGSNSSNLNRSRRISTRSSKTSALGSSADELFMSTDRLPRSISNSKSRNEKFNIQSDDKKSSIISAHEQVENIGRLQNDRTSKSTKSIHSCSTRKSNTKSSSNNRNKSRNYINGQNTTRKQEISSPAAWWMDSNLDNVPDGVEKLDQSQEDMSEATTVSTNLPDDGNDNTRTWPQSVGGESSNTNNTDDLVSNKLVGIQARQTNCSHTNITWSGHENGLQHQRSGERAWWMSDDPAEVPDGIEIYPAVSYNNSSVSKSTPISSHNDEVDNSNCFDEGETFSRNVHKIRHIDSGEKAWWMDSTSSIPEGVQKISPEIRESRSKSDGSSGSFEKLDNHHSSSSVSNGLQRVTSLSKFPDQMRASSTNASLGDRVSPEGVEHSSDSYEARVSSYDDVHPLVHHKLTHEKPSNFSHFIGNHTNIDDVLDVMTSSHYNCVLLQVHKEDMADEWDGASECEEIDAAGVVIHDSTSKTPVIQRRRRYGGRDTEERQQDCYSSLDDTALQLYKDGDYGAYLDLEASISEQQEEFESFQTNRKNSIILRTQLSVRVHTIIEKLLNSEGRELRRALFSLKQIFQEDKDLVHEFVQNDGLACLIKVGNEADQNYQNYILRALGQVMLYVDGMNGVMEHGQTVQWLYTLIASRFRLVVKTALKLLLVFVEYIETNSLLLVRAVRSIDTSRGMIPWTNVMKLLKDYDAADTELLIYATTLINKCLNGIPDQDTYYDQVDCLEEQGIEGIIQRYMSKQGTDLDLLRQFQIYEAVLHHEDGNDRGSPIRQLDDNIRKTLRSRNCLVDSNERRKSRRHSTGTSPLPMSLNVRLSPRHNHSLGLNSINGSLNSSLRDDDEESSSSHSSQGLADVPINGGYKENKDDVGVTPALRRRRERAERQRSFIREQQEATATMRASVGNLEEKEVRYANGAAYERNNDGPNNKVSRGNSRKDLTPLMNAANKLDSEEKKPWYGKSHDEGVECDEGNHSDEDKDRKVLVQMKRDGTVKDLTQKLAAQNLIANNTGEEKISRIGDMSGLISKAKEGLAKSKSKADILKLSSGENVPKLVEVKKSENELHWEELVNQMKRPLTLCDLDFTDLNSDDEVDVLGPVNITNGVPPPPPPMVLSQVNGNTRAPPPPPLTEKFPPPFLHASSSVGASQTSNRSPPVTESISSVKCPTQNSPKKNKKTVKLFWKEVREDPGMLLRLEKNTTIWDELISVSVDTQKLEHLFESRAKDLITKKQQEMNKNKEIIVLDHKRSNTINIGMTKLPPPRSIKTAILKMDATIMSREGIEKLLTMLPTEDERSRIQDAQAANPDVPLGSAEQFLLTLASISELPARLKLWAFKLDFENSEKEIADPLMDLKQGMETLKMNKTFRGILSTLLSIGIFLNGNEVKGFQLEYLTKVPEVKDTVHKHSLLHHLCHMVMEKFPDSTDLYSEIGAVTRASKIDFDELAGNISKLENECKASWDHLKLIAKHDGSTTMKVKMSDFLADCAERIIVLGIVHRRVINRFHKFILWLGVPLHRVQDTKPNEFCRIVSEFALEYRTTRERVIQQLEKKANHRERNKTRGKMITEVGKFRTKEDRADAELRQLLGSDISDVESIHGTLPWRRQRKEGRTSLGPIIRDETPNGNITDGDDELLESLVKTATKSPVTRATPRERKRTRHADRKSLRRTLKSGLSEEEKKHIAAYIKGY